MTDFMENLLSSMSAAFNSTKPNDNAPIDLNDDKTLKWRALQNNQYARKLMKKKRVAVASTTNDGTTEGGNSSSSSADDDSGSSRSSSSSGANNHKKSRGNVVKTTINMNASGSKIKLETELKSTTVVATATTSVAVAAARAPEEGQNNIDNFKKKSNHQNNNSNDDKTDVVSTKLIIDNKGDTTPTATDEINSILHKKLRSGGGTMELNENSSTSTNRRQTRSRLTDSISEDGNKKMTAIQNENEITPPKRRGRSKKIIENKLDENLANDDDHTLTNSNKKLRRSDRNSLANDVKIEDSLTTSNTSGISSTITMPVTTANFNDKNYDDDSAMEKTDLIKGAKRTRRSTRLEVVKGDEENIMEITKNDGETPRITITGGVKEEQQSIVNEPQSQLSPPPPPVPSFPPPSIKSPTDINNTNYHLSYADRIKSNTDKKLQKRRGRRSTKAAATTPRINFTVTSQNNHNNKDNNNLHLITRITKTSAAITKELPSLSKRPLRRIKPTPKILENDELRYEYETKNIARITACSAEMAEITSPPPPVETDENNGYSTDLSKTSIHKKDIKDHLTPPPSTTISHQQLTIPDNRSYVKKKLFPKSSINGNDYSKLLPSSARRPCPDPEQFLNEIKAAKINLNKSPEDKKLNRKQQRKLLKQKEKHFEKLGLKRNSSRHGGGNEMTDSEQSSGENDEFVPSKKIHVGKPNVTLRIRSTPKDGYIAIPGCSKEIQKSTPPAATNATTTGLQQRKQRIKLNPQIGKAKTLSPTTKNSSTINNNNIVKTTSTVINTNRNNEMAVNLICLCHEPSHYYTRNTPDTAFCCAIDNIEEQKVGCCNQLSGELLNLLRPSQRVGYMILCDDHTKRMKAHNCCAGCGIFCTQGKFVLCQKEHFFHVECAQKFILNSPYDPTNTTDFTSPTLVLKCPHCGQDTPEKTSIVTMKCDTLPVFLPSQKNLLKPAKMTIPERIQHPSNKQTKRKVPFCVELENLIPESVMNVVVREGNTESSTNNSTSNEFTSKDMFYAVNNDDLERVAEILASGYDITSEMPEFLNGTCLHLVAHFGTIQMAYLLLCRESSDDFLNMIDKELRTAIMCSIIGEKLDILRLFIQCGSNLTKKGPDGMTCLHIAAKVGNLQATKLIVDSYKNSTNINLFEKFINSQDDGGWTAIVWAAELGFTDIVSFLLNNGASATVCDAENNSVLHWATLSNHAETISILLRSTIDCSVQNINGDTPLHIACRSSSTRICLMLIANGADLMVKNKADELPYDCIVDEESQCARAVGFNMQMRSFGPSGLRNKIVNSDISNGREIHPIQVIKRGGGGANERPSVTTTTNEVDEIMLPDFKYITKSILLQNSIQIDQRISQMRICSCSDGCSSDQCQCSTISVQNWYTPEGRLNGEFNYDDPAMIYECNDVCGCNKLMCKNRVVQNGIKIPLQIYECDEHIKGWGVRALTNILRGTFVAEYTGEILTDLEADRRTDDSYFFDLGASEHCIDANFYGNISRFFNHSCIPNIVPVRVYYEHQDFRFPKIAFFASQDIPDGEELCFDYGDKFWLIKQKYFRCKCLLPTCRYSNTTTPLTLSKNVANSSNGAVA